MAKIKRNAAQIDSSIRTYDRYLAAFCWALRHHYGKNCLEIGLNLTSKLTLSTDKHLPNRKQKKRLDNDPESSKLVTSALNNAWMKEAELLSNHPLPPRWFSTDFAEMDKEIHQLRSKKIWSGVIEPGYYAIFHAAAAIHRCGGDHRYHQHLKMIALANDVIDEYSPNFFLYPFGQVLVKNSIGEYLPKLEIYDIPNVLPNSNLNAPAGYTSDWCFKEIEKALKHIMLRERTAIQEGIRRTQPRSYSFLNLFKSLRERATYTPFLLDNLRTENFRENNLVYLDIEIITFVYTFILLAELYVIRHSDVNWIIERYTEFVRVLEEHGLYNPALEMRSKLWAWNMPSVS